MEHLKKKIDTINSYKDDEGSFLDRPADPEEEGISEEEKKNREQRYEKFNEIQFFRIDRK
jgi:hypothetical protein